MEKGDFEARIQAIRAGALRTLEAISAIDYSFPVGADPIFGHSWLMHAIELGGPEVVSWILAKGAPCSFIDDIGYTPLHLCIETVSPHKYRILALLVGSGAELDKKGLNDWTPLHLAAVRNDIRSTALLLGAGADPNIKTKIDLYATPAVEARALGATATADFIEGWIRLAVCK